MSACGFHVPLPDPGGDGLLGVPGGAAALGAYRADLADDYWAWEQDPAVLVGIGRRTLPSRVEHSALVQERAGSTLNALRFTVYDTTGDVPVPVGTCGVDPDYHYRSGMFYIALGGRGARGKGVGTEAARLTLDYAFHVAGIGCVYLAAFEPNVRAIRAYEAAGFERIGVRRMSGMWLGERVNEVLMDAVPGGFVGVSAVRAAVAG